MAYTPLVQTKKDYIFRYGQSFGVTQLRVNSQRNPYANFLTYGIINDVFGKGVEPIVDKDLDSIKPYIEKHIDVFEKACVYDRIYGKSLITMTENKGDFFFRAYPIDRYYPEYDQFGRLTKVVTHTITTTGKYIADVFEGKNLRYVYEIISRPAEDIGQGISVLEPIWDELYSLSLLDANATYFTVRVGGGLKVFKVTTQMLNDPKALQAVVDTIKRLDSNSSVVTIPIYEGSTVQPDLEFKSGDQIDFLSIRDLILGAVSVATSIPREAFLGNEIGMRSAEVNQESYFSALQNIQETYLKPIRWFFDMLIEIYKLNISYTDIKFGTHSELSAGDNIDLLTKKIQFTEIAKNYMSIEQIAQLIDLDIKEIIQ